ncbi:MAG: hypothetical protein JNK05_13570 [Myxococcales bacterium]|nr:hypothetical protein [Myxococcales bacterium]
MWKFGSNGRVEPTNNRAERAPRPEVLLYKSSPGNDGVASALHRAIACSASLAPPTGHNLLAFVADCIAAVRSTNVAAQSSTAPPPREPPS